MPLQIRKITRKGSLAQGSRLSWQWLANDRKVAAIGILVDTHQAWCSPGA